LLLLLGPRKDNCSWVGEILKRIPRVIATIAAVACCCFAEEFLQNFEITIRISVLRDKLGFSLYHP